MSTDLYQGISDFYDTFVQLNRDYKAIAIELLELFGNSSNILDVGIGTGLLVKQIIQLRPDLKIVGIDTSASLLAQAEKSLGTKVTLFCQDVSHLDLDNIFDLAYSRGGAWPLSGIVIVIPFSSPATFWRPILFSGVSSGLHPIYGMEGA